MPNPATRPHLTPQNCRRVGIRSRPSPGPWRRNQRRARSQKLSKAPRWSRHQRRLHLPSPGRTAAVAAAAAATATPAAAAPAATAADRRQGKGQARRRTSLQRPSPQSPKRKASGPSRDLHWPGDGVQRAAVKDQGRWKGLGQGQNEGAHGRPEETGVPQDGHPT